MSKHFGRRALAASSLAVIVFAAIGCSSSTNSGTGTGMGTGTDGGTDGNDGGTVSSVTVRIAESSWLGSKVNSLIAKQLLTEQMGVNVEIIAADETAQWEDMKNGKLDVCLEVWPSRHQSDYDKYVKAGQVADGGELGVLSKIGWYIPSYLLAANPELATWEGFQNPANAALFATPETGAKGRFLGGVSDWVQYDEDIIRNLKLPLQVVHAGSEDALLDEVDQAYNMRKPILFYFWVPHWALAKYDLTAVTLPAYNDACYAKQATGGIDCDYPTERLYKIYRPGLQTEAPKVYEFIKAFSYSTKDQIAVTAAVQLEKKTPEDAAKAWIDANKAKWEAWIQK